MRKIENLCPLDINSQNSLSLFHINLTIVWQCDFQQASGREADRRQNCIPHVDFLRQPYDSRTVVLSSRAGLLQGVLHICKTVASATVRQSCELHW